MESPNLLILYTDQQRWDALGANGNPDIQTPNLDRLADRSVNFDHCFVQNPVCMPSRVSFLTGRYPSALGITHMGVPVPEEYPNIATYFGTAGYHCANIGKLHFLPHANRDHTRPHPTYGFDHLEISDEPGVYADAYRAWVKRHAPDQLDHLSAGLPPARKTWLDTMEWDDPVRHPPTQGKGGRFDFGGPIPFPGRDDVTHTAFVGQRIQSVLRNYARLQQPFACIAGFYSPHAPWIVPQTFLDRYDPASFSIPDDPVSERKVGPDHLRAARHGYYAMVTEVDEWVGRILSALDETGLADNTVVVFTSDHGEWLGEQGRWGKGFPAHDACSRVPLLVSAPHVKARRVEELVEAVDVLPTLLELAGLPVPTDLQGRSLAPFLADGSSPAHRRSALTEHDGWRSLRTADFRYVVRASGDESLFDLRQPGGASTNVAPQPDYAEALATHRHELIVRMLSAEQPIPKVWPY